MTTHQAVWRDRHRAIERVQAIFERAIDEMSPSVALALANLGKEVVAAVMDEADGAVPQKVDDGNETTPIPRETNADLVFG